MTCILRRKLHHRLGCDKVYFCIPVRNAKQPRYRNIRLARYADILNISFLPSDNCLYLGTELTKQTINGRSEDDTQQESPIFTSKLLVLQFFNVAWGVQSSEHTLVSSPTNG